MSDMKRIYFRGGELPFEYVTPERALNRNYLGSNSGNLLYQYGILKALMTSEDDILESNHYNAFRFSPDYVNDNFDMFIIPLADAFRESFVNELQQLTEFIKQLHIPCVVTGVGLRGPFEPDFKQNEYSFNEDVKAFMKAVLEKSAIVGVRGQITADYLSYLGFCEDRDFMVIGCPSMYSYGTNLDIKPVKLDYHMNLGIQPIHFLGQEVSRYFNSAMKLFPNWKFIGQLIPELRYIFIGAPFENDNTFYPCHNCLDEVYQNKKAVFFLNATTWINYMKNLDFTFGARLHGSIASILAGTPALLVAYDSRMRELSEYHKLNYCTQKEIGNYAIQELILNSDFSPMLVRHGDNFRRFCSFLKMNGLSNIYETDKCRKLGPIDNVIEQSNLYPAVEPLDFSDKFEIKNRMEHYFRELDEKISRLKAGK